MVKISGTTIVATQGDTIKTAIVIKNSDGTNYEVQNSDIITFGMKKSISDTACVVEKVIPHETMLLQLDSSDTNTLDLGDYFYDVELTKGSGEVATIINCGKIKLKGQVVNHAE